MSKNIAIAAKYFNWGGGLDFIHMIVKALESKSKEQNIKIYLFIPNEPNILTKSIKTAKKIIKIPYNIYKGKKKLYEKPKYFMTKECLDCFNDMLKNIEIVYHEIEDESFYKKLKEYNIDMILPIPSLIINIDSDAYIGYIPDLQHKYYPEFFLENDINDRDKNFISLLQNSNKIIVNAKSVKNDIFKFYEKYFDKKKCKIYNLPYSPLLENRYEMTEFKIVKRKYKLPEKYFVICNQMWKHKDHITAFKALRHLIDINEKYKSINIVCTGATDDYRFPYLFDELKSEIKAMKIEERVYFLRYIPKNDQLSIIRNSIGLLQPTLFEGGPGGFAVYEAVAMGIPAIVSDIDVNKEIDEENVLFFKAKSEVDLALKMGKVIENRKIRYSEEELIIKSNKRLKKLSEELYKIINY